MAHAIPKALFEKGRMADRILSAGILSSTSKELFAPRVDVRKLSDKYVISVELPGVENEDIDVDLKNGALIVTATLQEPAEAQAGRSILSERRYGTYKRQFTLGADAKEEPIQTHLGNGVLNITIPR